MIKKNNLKRLSIVAAVLGLAVGGSAVVANNYVNASNDTSAQVSSSKNVSTSKIKLTQAQAIAKFTEKYGNKSIESIELEAHRGAYIYTIEGFDSSKEYIVSVNAETGKVLRADSRTLDKDDKNIALNLDKIISRSEATKIAQGKVSGTAVEWNLETEDGKAIWSVEVEGSSKRTEVEIDATTGSVIKTDTHERKERDFKSDRDSFKKGHSREKITSVPSNIIKASEAISIAQDKVSGTVVGSELEKEDGKWIWKVELVNNSKEIEVEIDATTRKVISVENDD